MTEDQPRTWDLDRADPDFKDDVARRPGAEKIRLCYACGACSARCPVGDIDPDFDPRRLIRMVILGMRDQVLSSPLLWYCATCFTCQETCPEGVNFTEVLFALKNMAVEAGYFPPAMSAQTELLKNHGRLYEITDFENQNRGKYGLPELPERPDDFKTLLEQLKIEPREAD